MPAKLSQPVIDRVLEPLKAEWYSINPKISKRYSKKNSGRVGNHIEDLFDLSNHNLPGMPDSPEGEVKTYSLDRGKDLTVAKITAKEHKNFAPTFNESVVFKKMVRTILVTYNEIRNKDTHYKVKDGIICDLHRLDNYTLYELDQDFQKLTTWMKGEKYKDLTKGMSPPKTKYLTVTWSGTSEKPQPTWKFKSSFVKVLISGATSPVQDDYYQRQFVPA